MLTARIFLLLFSYIFLAFLKIFSYIFVLHPQIYKEPEEKRTKARQIHPNKRMKEKRFSGRLFGAWVTWYLENSKPLTELPDNSRAEPKATAKEAAAAPTEPLEERKSWGEFPRRHGAEEPGRMTALSSWELCVKYALFIFNFIFWVSLREKKRRQPL